MTFQQETAIAELQQIRRSTGSYFFDFESSGTDAAGNLIVRVLLHIGLLSQKVGGLAFRDTEEFWIDVPSSYPFSKPWVRVNHNRFAGFPHVIWGRWICLYQTITDWNEYDGMFGFIDRLRTWIERASENNTDPIDGPLEPPHASLNHQLLPFVIRKNAPNNAGELWLGLAEYILHENYNELVDWLEAPKVPMPNQCSLAIFLKWPMPIEFPSTGSVLLTEFQRQGVAPERLFSWLALGASFSGEGSPLYLIIGTPMRRDKEGHLKQHISVWHFEPEIAESLRLKQPEEGDSEKLTELRHKLGESVHKTISINKVSWCKVLEDRSEILVRRDLKSPINWFSGKKILIIGCGALGSWSAEILARANANFIQLVDNNIVKPGVLIRQNFHQLDIGQNKAKALQKRLESISRYTSFKAFDSEGFSHLSDKNVDLRVFDLILDCTASTTFQMQLELHWPRIRSSVTAFLSYSIDAKANFIIGTLRKRNDRGGIFDAYKELKYFICTDGRRRELISAFYEAHGREHLFQPEPGCSDLTFSGSVSDVQALAANALNIGSESLRSSSRDIGFALSKHTFGATSPFIDIHNLSETIETRVDIWTVKIFPKVFSEINATINQNKRLRSAKHETGGLIWGHWDQVLQTIWIVDVSGPPPDSIHDSAHFQCGIEGTREEHTWRLSNSKGLSGFIGFWHTHPNSSAAQSDVDRAGMANLVSAIDQNMRRALMLIVGKGVSSNTIGLYPYEAKAIASNLDCIVNGISYLPFRDGNL